MAASIDAAMFLFAAGLLKNSAMFNFCQFLTIYIFWGLQDCCVCGRLMMNYCLLTQIHI